MYSYSQRVINFADEIIPSEVNAKMNHGVLEIVVHKKEINPDQKMRRIELK